MGKAKGTHVRVSVEVRDRLRDECQQTVDAIIRGEIPAPVGYRVETINPRCCGWSFNSLIRFMLDCRQGHREARARSKEKRRRERRRAAKPAPVDLLGRSLGELSLSDMVEPDAE